MTETGPIIAAAKVMVSRAATRGWAMRLLTGPSPRSAPDEQDGRTRGEQGGEKPGLPRVQRVSVGGDAARAVCSPPTEVSPGIEDSTEFFEPTCSEAALTDRAGTRSP